jgi:hypothetical protein
MTTQELDQAKAAAFGGYVVGLLTGASVTPMLSVGHRTGLFDAMAGLSPFSRIREAMRPWMDWRRNDSACPS